MSRGDKIWLAANGAGIGLYLYFASTIWAPAGESCLPGGPGDPIIWGLLVFPVLVLFLAGNLVWMTRIIRGFGARRHWRRVGVWLVVVMVWIGVNRYDAFRQYSGHCPGTVVH